MNSTLRKTEPVIGLLGFKTSFAIKEALKGTCTEIQYWKLRIYIEILRTLSRDHDKCALYYLRKHQDDYENLLVRDVLRGGHPSVQRAVTIYEYETGYKSSKTWEEERLQDARVGDTKLIIECQFPDTDGIYRRKAYHLEELLEDVNQILSTLCGELGFMYGSCVRLQDSIVDELIVGMIQFLRNTAAIFILRKGMKLRYFRTVYSPTEVSLFDFPNVFTESSLMGFLEFPLPSPHRDPYFPVYLDGQALESPTIETIQEMIGFSIEGRGEGDSYTIGNDNMFEAALSILMDSDDSCDPGKGKYTSTSFLEMINARGSRGLNDSAIPVEMGRYPREKQSELIEILRDRSSSSRIMHVQF